MRAGEAEPRRARGQVGGPLGRRRHLPRSTARRRATRSSRSTRRRPRSAARCTWAHVFGYVQTDAIARFQRMRGPRGLLPDGLGRQRPPHRAAGAELLRRALRPVAAVRPRRSRRRRSRAKQEIPICRQNFVELCDRLVVEDEQKFEELWRTLGLSVDWAMTYTTIGERAAAGVAARVPAQSRARRGVPGGGADALGRRLPHGGRAGRARGPRAARRVPRGALRAAPTATPTS